MFEKWGFAKRRQQHLFLDSDVVFIFIFLESPWMRNASVEPTLQSSNHLAATK